MPENDVYNLKFNDKEITLIGTAHISRKSVELVAKTITEKKPDTVCIEICQSRFDAMTKKNQWQEMDLVKVIKEKRAFLLLSNFMLASLQKKIGKKVGITPGAEMLEAIAGAETVNAQIHLADRDIRTTLSRTWRLMGLWTKIKLFSQSILSLGEIDSIDEKEIEQMKDKDMLETMLAEMSGNLPEIRNILIDERDQYLCSKIRTAPGKKIVAVVGAGHIPGIKKYWDKDIDIEKLNIIPPKGKLADIMKWVIPVAIFILIIAGFFLSGAKAGTDMIKWWILANGIFAGLGAVIAFAHPLTIISAVVAAPITSLNPMIAAGWVSGLVEAMLRKPKVKDFENLPDDIVSFRGFWKNKITRVLLVVVLTNIGSAIGTFTAIPLMMKVFN